MRVRREDRTGPPRGGSPTAIPVPRPASRLQPNSPAPRTGNPGQNRIAVKVKLCLVGSGISRSSGWAASSSARTWAAALRQRSVGRRQWEEKTRSSTHPAPRRGLRLLPGDRLQLLDPPAHGGQGVQDLLAGGADRLRRPVAGEGQLVEAPDDLVARAAAAPLVGPAAGVQEQPAGGEHPPRLVQRPLPVGDQVQHVDLEHDVDAGVAEGSRPASARSTFGGPSPAAAALAR